MLALLRFSWLCLLATCLMIAPARALTAPLAQQLAVQELSPKATAAPAARPASSALAKPKASPAKPGQAPPKQTPAAGASASASSHTKKTKAVHEQIDAQQAARLSNAYQQLAPEARQRLEKLNAAMHEMDRAVSNDLRDEEEQSTRNLALMWQAAVERSQTIRYAIEKLSRRDATGKPVSNDSLTKRMLQSIVHLGGVAGTLWTGTPAGLIGGSMVQDLIQGDPSDAALKVKVTDADMLILAKEVETLQQQLMTAYYTYQHRQQQVALTQEAYHTLKNAVDRAEKRLLAEPSAQNGHQLKTLMPLMESVLETSHRDAMAAQSALQQARTDLGLLVGEEAVTTLETQAQASISPESNSPQAKQAN
jgi:hypothetical protein